ncbi:site-specific integrase, partial [Enterococcus faecalis]
MSITKTKNGTYRLRMYIPEEAKSSLGIDKKVIEKRFKTRSEAKKYELEFQNKIEKVLSGETMVSSQNNGSILFSDFYKNVWWESYKAGQTTSTTKPPTRATIDNTEIVFRKH